MKLNMITSSVLVPVRATEGVCQASDVASSAASFVMKESTFGGKGRRRP